MKLNAAAIPLVVILAVGTPAFAEAWQIEEGADNRLCAELASIAGRSENRTSGLLSRRGLTFRAGDRMQSPTFEGVIQESSEPERQLKTIHKTWLNIPKRLGKQSRVEAATHALDMEVKPNGLAVKTGIIRESSVMLPYGVYVIERAGEYALLSEGLWSGLWQTAVLDNKLLTLYYNYGGGITVSRAIWYRVTPESAPVVGLDRLCELVP